jgi:hypothetical protein
MKIRRSLKLAVTACSLLTIFGCGGGGGGGTTTTPGTPGTGGTGGTSGAPPAPIAALTLSTQGTLPSGTVIGGVDVIVNLPAGVVAKADTSGATEAGICNATGLAAGGTTVAKFSAASGATPAQIRMAVIKADGFASGEFVTTNLDFSGTAPTAGDFTIAAAFVSDINGVTVSGLTVVPTVQIK